MTVSNPSINPADEDTLTGTFRHVFLKLMQQKCGFLPVRVIAFDRGNPNRVQVQHVIKQIISDGTTPTRGQVGKLPVFQFGGGGFVINCPLVEGDFGWILAADRDISVFLQSYQESAPQTFRMHEFSDALFIPDKMMGVTIAPENIDALVIQSVDGTVCASFKEDEIRLKAPTVVIDSPEATFTGAVITRGALTAQGGVSGSGGGSNSLIMDGNVRVNGNIAATGSITPDVPP